jgi:hypothetical protein
MIWVKLVKANAADGQVYGRIDSDGVMRVTCVEEHPELIEWLQENEALELDEYLASLEGEPSLPEVIETPETSEAE